MTVPTSTSAVRTLLARGAVYTIATTAQGLSMLVVVPLVTRLLADSEGYGVVAAAQVVIQMVGLIAGLGLAGAVTREFFEPDGGPEHGRRLVVSTAVAALCVAGVAELTGPWWSQVFATLDYDTPLRLAVWTTVPVAVVASCQALLRAKDAAGRFVVVTILATLGAQGAGLVGLLVADGEPSVYLGGLLVGVCLAALAGVVLAEAIVLPAGIVVLRRALAIGLPTVPHSLAALALVAADRVVVENELGLAEAGRYQLAYLLGASAVSVLIAVNNSWAPLIYGAGEDRWELLAETAHALHRLTPHLVAPLALGAPLLLSVVADDSYDPRSLSPVLAVTALTTCGYVAYLSNVHVLFVHRAVGFLAVATPSVAAVNVVGNLVLVPRFGLTAAAWTSVGSYALLGRAVRWRARRLAQVPWRPGTTLSAWLPASVVVGLALTLPVEGSWLAVRAVLTAIAAGVALWQVAVMVRTS